MITQNRYPLSWPEGWKRTPRNQTKRSRFCQRSANSGTKSISMESATDLLLNELRRLNARSPLLSTNVKLRLDGLPYSNLRPPEDVGAAVYFQLSNKPRVLACDRWDRVEDNIYAMALHIAAMRGQERWGVGSIEQAFQGYQALPPVGGTAAPAVEPHIILGVPINANTDQIRDRYRALAKTEHPDAGGTHEGWIAIQQAYDTMMKARQ